MSVFNGKWKRIGATNVDAFIQAVGCDAKKAAAMKNLISEVEVMEDYTVTDTGTIRKLYVNGQFNKEVLLTYGQAQETETALGKCTLTTTKVSDTRIDILETASGRPDALSIINVDGNTLTLDYTFKGVTCRRTFQRQ